MNARRLRELMASASPQPWMNNSAFRCVHTHSDFAGLRRVLDWCHATEKAEANAELATAAVNALPELLDSLTAARDALLREGMERDAARALCRTMADLLRHLRPRQVHDADEDRIDETLDAFTAASKDWT